MRKIVVGTTTAALVLTCGLISTPAQASPVQPAEPATPTILRTVRVDVTGDGKADTVTLSSMAGSTQYELKVVTAKTTATATFTAQADAMAWEVWGGAAKLDGVKGAELIVHPYNPDTLGDFIVYTWRKGALVAETAPAAPSHSGWWTSDLHGFRFFTSRGRAYVDAANLASFSKNGAHWAKIVRSVWRSGKWVKVSTRSVKLSASRVYYYTGIQAPSILVNQAQADMDGDGKPDAVSFRFLAGSGSQTKIVTATGKVIKRSIYHRDFDGVPLIATIDGVPGAELAYVDGDGYSWKVLTVRKNKLVVVPSPEGDPTWMRSPEGFNEGYDLSVVNGQWQVITNSKSTEGNPITVTWWRYLWVSGKWTRQNTWTTTIAESEYGTLCSSFCGVDVIKL